MGAGPGASGSRRLRAIAPRESGIREAVSHASISIGTTEFGSGEAFRPACVRRRSGGDPATGRNDTGRQLRVTPRLSGEAPVVMATPELASWDTTIGRRERPSRISRITCGTSSRTSPAERFPGSVESASWKSREASRPGSSDQARNQRPPGPAHPQDAEQLTTRPTLQKPPHPSSCAPGAPSYSSAEREVPL
jgi:hypothetical protein